MNEGRIWLYVSPSVGIPLFFGAIVLAALLVHASILNNTTWFAGYWQGAAAEAAAPAAMEAAPAAEEAAPAAEEAAPVAEEAAPAAE
jgi:light-harvesting protein B-800-850 alpha chain